MYSVEISMAVNTPKIYLNTKYFTQNVKKYLNINFLFFKII